MVKENIEKLSVLYVKFLTFAFSLFKSMSYFYTPCKRQEIKGFLTFSGGIEIGDWREKG